MNNIAGTLSTMLNTEAEAYSNLYAILQKEREALIQWSIGELKTIVGQKETLLDKIQDLEAHREEFVTDVQHAFRNSGLGELTTKENLNLSDIIAMIKEQDTQHLLDIQKKLIELIKDVTKTNKRNQVLLKRSFEMVNANLDIFTQSEKLAKAYTARGEYRPIAEKHIIDGAI